jgi:hypothetical protein
MIHLSDMSPPAVTIGWQMSNRSNGIIVVGLRQDDTDIEDLKDQIASIPGVSGVDFNYLTFKLTVAHDGEAKTISRIEARLEGLRRMDS